MEVPGSLSISVIKMKKAKAPRVPVLESAFEVNLPKLLRAVKASGRPEVVMIDGDERTVAVLSDTRLAVHLGGRVWLADIVAVPCLNDRVRPLLKCPRAHEGNLQSLYWRAGELACRHCHGLRYRTSLVTGPVARARLAREKLVERLGGVPGDCVPDRPHGAWRKRYACMSGRIAYLTAVHYDEVRRWLKAASSTL
ncbi:hypothetical protein [Duganella vulcania]|uniref:Uncharacterized protein n=1 Tax=Duganella vulcania TaxID=2692166 RepID=A0A845GV23_9BURK|nr:hypothetical protein [Duganella vulcania]MYM97901.1 hypothetical protein [Duganella vulcania]